MPGRRRHHPKCPNTNPHSAYYGSVVNAYVRVGNPAQWTVIGQVCTDCGHLADFHTPIEEFAGKARRPRPPPHIRP